MPDNGDRGLTIAVASGAAVLGAAAAAPIAAVAPIASAALAAVVAETASLAVNAFGAYRQRRAAEWWAAFVANLGTMTAEGAVTEATLRSQVDAAFEQRVYHALSAVWAAIDEAVIPTLAYLAADYQARGLPADGTYKRLARFLQETSGDELAMTRTLLAEVDAELAALRVSPAPRDPESRSDGVPVVAQRTGGRATVGQNRQVLLGNGCASVVQRLENEQLIDGHNVFGDYAAGYVTRDQLTLLLRYMAKPLF